MPRRGLRRIHYCPRNQTVEIFTYITQIKTLPIANQTPTRNLCESATPPLSQGSEQKDFLRSHVATRQLLDADLLKWTFVIQAPAVLQTKTLEF